MRVAVFAGVRSSSTKNFIGGFPPMLNIRMNTMTSSVQKILPKIVVAGIGGAGGNAVNNMILAGTSGVDFIVLNTDAQALVNNSADTKIQLGASLTEGLGAGAKPEVGRNAAAESLDDIMQHLDTANMVFITAGMGGGTGTGAAPVIAKACRERGILTVGVVTKPFHFEGTHRMKMAEEGIAEMQSYVDTLIVIPNQNLFRVVNEKTTFAEAFKLADGVLQAAVRGVTDLIVNPGVINLDFADIRSVMLEMGKAVMGMGEATGDRRASEAAEKAINNPLLDDVSMKGARGVIVNIAGGYDMTLFEVDEACNRIRDEVDANANIIFGSSFDESMEGTMRVSVIATGIDAAQMAKTTRAPQSGAFAVERPSQLASQLASQKIAQQQVTAPSSVTRTVTAPAARPVYQSTYQSVYQQSAVTEAKSEPAAPTYAQIAQASFVMQNAAERFVQSPPQSAAQAVSTPAAYDEAQLQNSVRGARYQGAFIPPEPQESGRDHNTAYQNWSGVSVQNAAQNTGQSQVEPVREVVTDANAQATPRRKSPSLFERITGGIRREIDAVRSASREELSFADDGAQSATEQNTRGGVSQSMNARKSPELPVQGRLNIDAPAAPAADSELDIPAFLRRQAN